MNIYEAVAAIIKIEGGYSNHPADKGGPTNFGVTQNVARAYGYMGAMQDLPKAVAQDIYIQRYWVDPKFDQVSMLSSIIAEEMLDTGINMGQGVAVKFLQRALNTLNREARDYPDVTVDGVLGNISLRALKDFLKIRGAEGERALFRMLNAQQSVRYMEISERNPSQEVFSFGWQRNRVV
jgi:lysozyme family protein